MGDIIIPQLIITYGDKMKITLFVNKSERNKLIKSLTVGVDYECNLLNAESLIRPSITLVADLPVTKFNYCYIEDFGRYYFIENITAIKNHVWELDLYVDVLHTYSQQIKNCECIVNSNESANNYYLQSDKWVATVRDKTEVIQFPTGLSNSGEFILITAGG